MTGSWIPKAKVVLPLACGLFFSVSCSQEGFDSRRFGRSSPDKDKVAPSPEGDSALPKQGAQSENATPAEELPTTEVKSEYLPAAEDPLAVGADVEVFPAPEAKLEAVERFNSRLYVKVACVAAAPAEGNCEHKETGFSFALRDLSIAIASVTDSTNTAAQMTFDRLSQMTFENASSRSIGPHTVEFGPKELSQIAPGSKIAIVLKLSSASQATAHTSYRVFFVRDN